MRKKVREEGGGKAERNCPPSHGNELPDLAPLAGAQTAGAGIIGHLSEAGYGCGCEDRGVGRVWTSLSSPRPPRSWGISSPFLVVGLGPKEKNDTLLLL